MVICSYNDHLRLLSPEPFWLLRTTKAYSGLGADIVMESISRIDRVVGVIAMLNSNTYRQQERTLVRSRIGTMGKRPWWLLAVLLRMNVWAVNEHKGFCPPAPPSLVAAKKNLENFKPAILETTTLWNVERLYFRQESGAPAGARR